MSNSFQPPTDYTSWARPMRELLAGCVAQFPSRIGGRGALALVPPTPGMRTQLDSIPGVFRDPRDCDPELSREFFVPHNLWVMGQRPTLLPELPIDPVEAAPSGVKLKIYQRQSVTFLRRVTREAQGCILGADAGLGKQQPIDTHVPTPFGWRNIGDLRVGDLVFGSDGRPTEVTGVYPQGVKPSYRLRLSDGSAVESGPDHLWTVLYRVQRRKPYKWGSLTLTTAELHARGIIEHENADGSKTALDLGCTPLYIPMLQAPLRYEKKALPIHPYLLGLLISNGGLGHGSPCLVTGVADWPDVLKNLQACGIPPSSVRQYANAVHATFSGICSVIRQLDLACGSYDKRIPRGYLESSVPDRIDLLHGLMDGDGTISAEGNKISYCTINSGLGDDVVELVEGLGGIASKRCYDRIAENKPTEYPVRMRFPAEIAPFTISRKLSRYLPGKNSLPVRTVTSVEYIRDVESVCISVGATDALYATEHCILTHNTLTTLQALWLDGYLQRGGLIVGPLGARGVWCESDSDPIRHYGLTVTPLDGTDPTAVALEPNRWYFIHYDVIPAWQSWLFRDLKPAAVIFDELHMVMNPDGKRFKAALVVSSSASIERRYGLTGTPIPKTRMDLYGQLAVVQPGQWGINKYAYGVRYANGRRVAHQEGGHWVFDGQTNTDELRARLAGVYLRYTKADVASDLPKLVRHRVAVELEPAVRKEYRQARDSILKWQEAHGKRKAPDTIMLGSVEVKIDEDKPKALQLVTTSTLKSILDRGKLPQAAAVVDSMLTQHKRIVVFTWKIDSAKQIHKALRQRIDSPSWREAYGTGIKLFGPIDGTDDWSVRRATAKAFASAQRSILVATRGSVGIAINDLSAADACLQVTPDWNPDGNLQAESRLHREGAKAPEVHSYYMLAEGTLDDRVLELLDAKSREASTLAGHDTAGMHLAADLDPTLGDDGWSMDEICGLLKSVEDIGDLG